MDISDKANELSEKAEKLSGSPLRFVILLVGILLMVLSSGILTWKRSAERSAEGAVKGIQLVIAEKNKAMADSEDADVTKKLKEKVKELKEDLEEAQMDAMSEEVDSNKIWLPSMIGVLGTGLVSLGLLLLVMTGTQHERLGALVALGFVLMGMR